MAGMSMAVVLFGKDCTKATEAAYMATIFGKEHCSKW